MELVWKEIYNNQTSDPAMHKILKQQIHQTKFKGILYIRRILFINL